MYWNDEAKQSENISMENAMETIIELNYPRVFLIDN